MATDEDGRTALKRRQITEAALALFLRQGYAKTSMDQIAADAQVSKQTVYKQYSDKETLFRELALGIIGASDRILQVLSAVLEPAPETTAQLQDTLQRLTRTYLDSVMQPQVLALRRLLIAEADQFADLAHEYYTWGPQRAIGALAGAVQDWGEKGLIDVTDASAAASRLAFLTLGPSLDRAMFHPGWIPSVRERKQQAAQAAEAFLAAHRKRT
ncbi:TetR/AcrR family transcriptional regulator [Microbacterium sp. NPDC057659]|uniref:TetR/AcrR family transcriptional regulator n=1 Tax=Microbacterium sp. NPDC057659 TaxID=3346198 RepID=UPI00366CEF14